MGNVDYAFMDFTAHPRIIFDSDAGNWVAFYNRTICDDTDSSIDFSVARDSQWQWDFGDGSSDPEAEYENPLHKYPRNTVPGSINKYTVKLTLHTTMYGGSLSDLTMTDYIWVVNDQEISTPRTDYDNHGISSIFISPEDFNENLDKWLVLNRTPIMGGWSKTPNLYFNELEVFNALDKVGTAKFTVWNRLQSATDDEKAVLTEGSIVHIINGECVIFTGHVVRVEQGKNTYFQDSVKEISWDVYCEDFKSFLTKFEVNQSPWGDHVEGQPIGFITNWECLVQGYPQQPYWGITPMDAGYYQVYEPFLNFNSPPIDVSLKNMDIYALLKTMYSAANFDWRMTPTYSVFRYTEMYPWDGPHYPFDYIEIPIAGHEEDIAGWDVWNSDGNPWFLVDSTMKDGSRNPYGVTCWGKFFIWTGGDPYYHVVRLYFANPNMRTQMPEVGTVLLTQWPMLDLADRLCTPSPVQPGQYVINYNLFEFNDIGDKKNYGTILRTKTIDEQTGDDWTSSLPLNQSWEEFGNEYARYYGQPWVTVKTDGRIYKLPGGTSTTTLYLDGWGYGYETETSDPDHKYRDYLYMQKKDGTWFETSVDNYTQLNDTDEDETRYTQVTLYTAYNPTLFNVGALVLSDKIRVNKTTEDYQPPRAFDVGMETMQFQGVGTGNWGPFYYVTAITQRGVSGTVRYPHSPGTWVCVSGGGVNIGDSPRSRYGDKVKDFMPSTQDSRGQADAITHLLALARPLPFRKAKGWCRVWDFWKKNRQFGGNENNVAFPLVGDKIEVLKYYDQPIGNIDESGGDDPDTYWQIISYRYNSDRGTVELELGDIERDIYASLTEDLTPIKSPFKSK